MKVEYSADKRVAFFDGYKFRKDLKTGYYLATRKTDGKRRERLHCYVWRYYNGEIPAGYHIHHMDEDKDHNEIENLNLVMGTAHTQLHSKKRAVENYEAVCKNLIENAVPKAAEWHGSEEGRLWHSAHAKHTVENARDKEFVCECCGKHFTGKPFGQHKFCTNACKTRARFQSGVDDEKRICVVCGGEFIANKYSSKRCCSSECSLRLRRSGKRQKNRAGVCV